MTNTTLQGVTRSGKLVYVTEFRCQPLLGVFTVLCTVHPVSAPEDPAEISAHRLTSFLLQNNRVSAQWRGAGGFLKIPTGSCV